MSERNEVASTSLFAIPFTQFLLPNGRPKPVSVARPKAIADKAAAVIAIGGRFTAEVLSSGEVSLALEYDDTDYDMELTENGPDVLEAVDRLVNRAHEVLIANTAISAPRADGVVGNSGGKR